MEVKLCMVGNLQIKSEMWCVFVFTPLYSDNPSGNKTSGAIS